MQLLFGWRRNLEDLLYRHGGLVLLMTVLFLTGLVFGALAVRSLDGPARVDLGRQVADSVLLQGQEPQVAGGHVLMRDAVVRRLLLLGLLWVLAISLAGAPGVFLLVLLQGFVSGYTVAFLAAQFGGRGILLAAAGHLPQRLLEVPALLLGSVAAAVFAYDVISSWRTRRRLSGYYGALAGFTGHLLSAGVLLLGAAMVEAYLSPLLVRIVSVLWTGPGSAN